MIYKPILPTQPTNIIFTGVTGTGKTYTLLQLQRLYDETIPINNSELKTNLIKEYSWLQIICAVLLAEDRMMSIAEIQQHPLLQDKIKCNNRHNNISQTLWNCLGSHSHPDSTTVNYTKRSANYYFDKTENNNWYLLDDVKPELLATLADIISLYSLELEQTQQASKSIDRLYQQPCKPKTQQCTYISRSCMVSFHQSYGYDEFVEGIRPIVDSTTGQMRYQIQAGSFLQLCRRAQADPEHRYAMLIDEINRTNTVQVFGELMSLIELDKRQGQASAMQVTLAYSQQRLSVPANLDIYATMNTQDHSLSLLDDAFRRRFEFVEMLPDSSHLPTMTDEAGTSVSLSLLMHTLNARIKRLLGQDYQLGQSYFYHIHSITELAKRFARQILPKLMHSIQSSIPPNHQYTLFMSVLYGERFRDKHILAPLIINPTHTYQHKLLGQPNQSDPNQSTINELGKMSNHSSTLSIGEHEQQLPTIATSLLTIVSYIERYDSQTLTIDQLKKDLLKDNKCHPHLNDELVYLTAKAYQQLYIESSPSQTIDE